MIKRIIKKRNEKHLINYMDGLHIHDLSREICEVNDKEKQLVYKLLSDERLSKLISHLELEDATLVFKGFSLEKQKSLIELMEPDDATDIIKELSKPEQKLLLLLLGEASDVSKLIIYDEDETGSVMTNLVVILTPEMDVKTATKKVIKEAADIEAINTLFVVNKENTFLGIVQLKQLIKTRSPAFISDIMERSPFVLDRDAITQTLESINNYGVFEMPVCDYDEKLVGMITLDDALDIYQEEAQEDFERLAGLPETVQRNVVRTSLKRLPWLLLLLVLFIPIAFVTSMFEDILAAVVILIVFQPLILDSAGNVATQTLAVTLKMLSTNEKGFVKNSIKEIMTGVMNGIIIGVIAFGVTYTFAITNTSLTTQPILLSFVVGISLWLTVVAAPIIAILIPTTLRALKIDPAVASGPFITTLIDIAALFIYFGFATLVLGGL